MYTHKKLFKAISTTLIFSFFFSFVLSPNLAFAHHWDEHGQQQFPTTESEPPPEDTQGPQEPAQDNSPESEVLDPMYLHSGEFALTRKDITIPSRGIPLEIIFTYRSQKTSNLRWGYGWFMNYDYKLEQLHENNVVILDGTGRIDEYTYNEEDASYTAPAGIYTELIQNQDGSFTLTQKDKTQYHFDLNGNLTSIIDRNQNTLSFTYDEAGLLPVIGSSEYFTTQTQGVIAISSKLLKITDSIGRELQFSYDENGRISSIADSTGRAWNYSINLDGDLETVTMPTTSEYPQGLSTTYTYSNHNLETITDFKNQAYLVNTYDEEDRLYSQEYGNNGPAHIDYDEENQTTTITDRKGYVTEYKYDDNGNISQKTVYTANLRDTDPDYYQTSYEHNPNMQRSKIIYPRGNTIQYTYDEENSDPKARGNLLEIRKKPISGSSEDDIVTTFTYESRFNFVKTLTDPKGNIITYTYDYELDSEDPNYRENGNLVKITYPTVTEGTPEVSFTYNSYGQVETVTDPNNIITKYEYYPDTGYLKQTTQDYGGLASTAQFTYDVYGNIDKITDPNSHTTDYDHNSLNQLIQITSAAPFDYVTKYSYDENGNLSQVDRQADEEQTQWQTTQYSYTILDQLEAITDALGNTTTFTYGLNGNRQSITDAEENTTFYTYDERNLLWKTTDALGNTTEYAYDENTNLSEIKDANLNITQYTYDGFGRLKTTSYADGSTENYTYDTNSNLYTKTDAKSQTLTYSYDALNRLDLKTYPDGTTIDYVYDLGSRLTDVVDSNGTLTYIYDNLNRVTDSTGTTGLTVSYEYDLNGNRTKLIYPDGDYITYSYDEFNRLTKQRTINNELLAFYSYDPLSRRTKLKLANNTQAIYTYDDANRLTNLANQFQIPIKPLKPKGSIPAIGIQKPVDTSHIKEKLFSAKTISNFGYTYDKVGNRISEGRKQMSEDRSFTYDYDLVYQLTSVSEDQGENQEYDYDPVGNRETVTQDSQTTTYITNNLNQYTNVDDTVYSYDLNGNLTSDGTWTYTYDFENRLTSATDDTTTATYQYDPFGRRVTKDDGGGTIVNYVYAGDQIIAEYDEENNLLVKYVYGVGVDEVLTMQRDDQAYYYHTDGLTSISEISDADGAVVEKYTYDVYGQPSIYNAEGSQIPDSRYQNRFMFTGREYDSETGLYYYRARYYHPGIGRFLQRDPLTWQPNDPRLLNFYSFNKETTQITLTPLLEQNIIALLLGFFQDYLRVIQVFGLSSPSYLHLYTYCFNNPINWIDPLGLDSKRISKEERRLIFKWLKFIAPIKDPINTRKPLVEEIEKRLDQIDESFKEHNKELEDLFRELEEQNKR